jgi:hypothetical protein
MPTEYIYSQMSDKYNTVNQRIKCLFKLEDKMGHQNL